MIHKNVKTDFSPEVHYPDVDKTAFVHPEAAVIGNTHIGKRVFVAPHASVRGDEGQPLYVGDESNVQDGVIIHALETFSHGKPKDVHIVKVDNKDYGVYIAERVSLAHQVQIHGPAFVGKDTFVGMKSLVFKAHVGEGCVIEPGCILMGVNIPDRRYVPALTAVTSQEDADKLPEIDDTYPLKHINQGVVHVNTALADEYLKVDLN